MVRRNLNRDFDSYCITDRPAELDAEITPLEPFLNVTGWWNKTLAFSPNMPPGINFLFDIDLVIVGNITEEINFCIDNFTEMATYRDANGWMGSVMSSSFMMFKTGELTHIFEDFKRNWPALEDFSGGDQVWLWPKLKDVMFVDDQFPLFKKSFKFDLAKLRPDGSGADVPKTVDPSVKIIDFHGVPKPHQLLDWPLVRQHWN